MPISETTAAAALRQRIEIHYEIRAEAVTRGRVTPRYAADAFILGVLGVLTGAEDAGFPLENWSRELMALAALRVRQLYPGWDAFNTERAEFCACVDITVNRRP